MKSFSSVHASAEAESDGSKRRAANKYEHLMKDSENRSERMSEKNIDAVVKRSEKLARQLSSQGSAMASINKSVEMGSVASIEEMSEHDDKDLTETQEMAVKKITSPDKSESPIEIVNQKGSDDEGSIEDETEKESPSPSPTRKA